MKPLTSDIRLAILNLAQESAGSQAWASLLEGRKQWAEAVRLESIGGSEAEQVMVNKESYALALLEGYDRGHSMLLNRGHSMCLNVGPLHAHNVIFKRLSLVPRTDTMAPYEVASPELIAAFLDLEAEDARLHKLDADIHDAVTAACDWCETVEALVDYWPEVVAFLPNLLPDKKTPPALLTGDQLNQLIRQGG